MKRAWKVFGWIALAVLMVSIGTVLWISATETGGRWALQRVPGLEVEEFEGRIGGAWRASRITWRDGERAVTLGQPSMRLRPGCLGRQTLCIEHAHAEQLEIDLPAGDEADEAEPPQLPDLRLPFGLRIDDLSIGQVVLNGAPLLDRIALKGHWTRQGLKLESLSLAGGGASLDVTGSLVPEGDWPLQLHGEAQLPAPEQQPWKFALDIAGELSSSLQVRLASQGYIEGLLSGDVRPLHPDLPAELEITIARLRMPDLPETLELEQLRLTMRGDLEGGYRLEGGAGLPGEGGRVTAEIEGLLQEDQLRLERLALLAGEQRFVELDGQVGWGDAIKADINLHWRNFPWYWLYPQQPPPVQLDELTAQVQYEDGNYLGHFDARLQGPAGAFTLASPVSGDLESVHLPQLELVAGQGRAEGSLGIDFAEGLGWSARLEVSELDPAYWVEALPGALGGRLVSEGRIDEGQIRAQAELALAGRLRGEPAELEGQARVDGNQWRVSGLDLRLGDNRVTGEGSWGDRLEGALVARLDSLAQLWPDLAGQAGAKVNLSGTREAPNINADIQGNRLVFADLQLETLRLNGSLSEGERATVQFTADGLQQGETEWGRLRLEGDGTLDAHAAVLSLEGPVVDANLALEGALVEENWRGRLLRAEVNGLDQRWTLKAPATLTRYADGRLVLGEHCWRSAPASLCAQEQRLFPEPQLDLALRDLPLERFAEFLPPDFAWQGLLAADLALEFSQAGPRGSLRADAGPGVLRLREGERWLDFPYEELSLSSTLRPSEALLQARFVGGELGELELQARTDPLGEIKPLDGTFRLEGFHLAVLRPLIPNVDRLEGRFSGSGELAGSLQQPLVRGQLQLANGLVVGEELPTRLENLRLDLVIDGREVQVDGSWRAGPQGVGRLTGMVDWRDALSVNLNITGQNLPVVVEPYAEVEANPALKIRYEGQRLAVSGRIDVPRGLIQIRDLPPATVRVSPDAVIVGEDEPPESPLEISMDVIVEVGQERLRFIGLGLTADLVGRLHIGDNLATRGELELKNGRYRAYGQRLSLRRARLLFTGPLSQPFLDIEAVRRIESEDVTAGLRITGSTRNPVVEVFAEPAMSEEQALSYLVLGRAPGAETGDSNLLAQAALGLGLARSSRVTGAVADRLGIEDFQLETDDSGGETSVVASGRLTDRLTLRYGIGVFESGNTLSLRYQLTKRLFLEAASGLANSLDLFYRRDF